MSNSKDNNIKCTHDENIFSGRHYCRSDRPCGDDDDDVQTI